MTLQPREVESFFLPVSAAWKGTDTTPSRHVGPCPTHRIYDSCSLHSGTHGYIISQGHQQGEDCTCRQSKMILLTEHRREVVVCSPRTFHFAFGVWQDTSDALADRHVACSLCPHEDTPSYFTIRTPQVQDLPPVKPNPHFPTAGHESRNFPLATELGQTSNRLSIHLSIHFISIC